jgi:hypothetical protein
MGEPEIARVAEDGCTMGEASVELGTPDSAEAKKGDDTRTEELRTAKLAMYRPPGKGAIYGAADEEGMKGLASIHDGEAVVELDSR